MEEDQVYIQEYLNSKSSHAVRYLVNKYQSSVYTLCFRILRNKENAEEAAQDSFVKCFQSLNQLYDYKRFKPWLLKISFRTAIDHSRNIKQKTDTINKAQNVSVKDKMHPESFLSDKERKEVIEKLLTELPIKDQAIVQLFYMEDLPIKQISNILSLSKSNVKVKLMRIRQHLFERLNNIYRKEIKNLL